ncbi:MAG: TetR/AcrR family transcriptional regulator [Clostridiales bacterium]|jgi:TetR/AcrR family transcriptional repressor of nem operon|nr:TetR/AcrR family transcriptional regulator [Clostridiales bacterium]
MARTKEFDEIKVLNDILTLFWEKGFHQSSLEDITRACGLGKQSLYGTYGNKRELFLKTLVMYREKNISLIRSKIEELIESGEAPISILQKLLFCNDGKGCMAISSMIEFKGEDEEVRKEIVDLLCLFREMVLGLVAKGQTNGEITDKMPPERIADVLMNARNGFQVAQFHKMPGDDLNNVASWTIDLIRA